jgi:hypothetical protein
MKKLAIGFMIGLAAGAAVPAAAAKLVGDTGYLFGWTVTKDGEDICYMPFVWTATLEIECD